ncbi:DUF1801 domain-containing protein [Paraglaciecola arctica]|uniref:YdhG-like domain-containing protein n=1 Tax=Paraglaciecola arctica BSs20135 TaxID=493475 RepID=K6ZD68_9ALTE|nr:DUF1801 domain-containing protein [Paraglaciecola arctica]GAC21340.1 hypothetical protein GARC_4398 [Paraglaciecola arctica BSs20135]
MDIQNSEIRQVFDNCQPKTKQALLTIRQWIFEIAKSTEQIGQIAECLKWGEPSYVTASPKSGTTLRLSQLKSNPEEFGLFVHCQTSLIEEFRQVYADFQYDKNRGVIFDSSKPLQTDAIKQFIFLALTYHCRKTE